MNWKRHKHSRTTVVNEKGDVVASCSWSDNTKDGLELISEKLATCRLVENAPRMQEILWKIRNGASLNGLHMEIYRVLDDIEYNEEDEEYLAEMNRC